MTLKIECCTDVDGGMRPRSVIASPQGARCKALRIDLRDRDTHEATVAATTLTATWSAVAAGLARLDYHFVDLAWFSSLPSASVSAVFMILFF